jgi:hypothetical protein
MKSLFIKWKFIFGNMAAFKECAFEIQTYNACFLWINGNNLRIKRKKITKRTIIK